MGTPSAEVRFLARINYDASGCWLWTGSRCHDKYGEPTYGRFSLDHSTTLLAHRVAYEWWVGPIPEGMELDHVRERGCKHKHCVNPAHLEPVNHGQNMTRAYAVRTTCPQGHPHDKVNARGHRICSQCHREAVARSQAVA